MAELSDIPISEVDATKEAIQLEELRERNRKTQQETIVIGEEKIVTVEPAIQTPFKEKPVYDVPFKPRGTLLVQYIRNKLKKGYSPIILFVGRQRVGKTALALRIAYEINPSFNAATDMFFRVEEFAEALHKGTSKVLILDEAGVSLDPYEHMSIQQRVYNHIIQTQAYKNVVVFLVLPFASEIGKQHRKHVHAIAQVFARGCYKLYRCQTWHADLSNKPPRLIDVETVVGVPLPPKHIWDVYLTNGQDTYKRDIMDLQLSILQKKNTPKKKEAVHYTEIF